MAYDRIEQEQLMNNKSAHEQINILENITVQILHGTIKSMKEQRKKVKYSREAKKFRKKFTKALRRMRELRRRPVIGWRGIRNLT